MSSAPNLLAVADFALRVVARPGRGDWLVLIAPETGVNETAVRLREEIEVLGDSSVEDIETPEGARALVGRVRRTARGKAILISGLEHFSEEEWRHLDLLRNLLGREGIVVLVMTVRSVEKLAINAPNLASWIGGSIWRVDAGSEFLSKEERATRLQSLRRWAKMDDSEVLRRAQDRTLPKEPEFEEWLVLLGRADLIGR